MLRESVSGYSLEDLSARCMIGQVLGQSTDGRLLVVPKMRLKKSARACRIDPRMLREDIIDHSLEDLVAAWMDVQILDGRARVAEFWCGFGSG